MDIVSTKPKPGTQEWDEAYVEYAAKLPVYFAYSQKLGQVKIGFSRNVRGRMQTLRSERGANDMVLIGWVDGGPEVERQMHAHFARLCVDVHSKEWFTADSAIAEWIRKHGNISEPPVVEKLFSVTDRGYWAARARLEYDPNPKVVKEFGDGEKFFSIPAPIEGRAA